jgi:hypothetical protein
MISRQVVENVASYRADFLSARPFPHIVIDKFLESDVAELMLRDFPAFDPKRALNEMGEVGGKAVVENVAEISPYYSEFSEYIKGEAFLNTISAITGIDDLLPDETLFGGGTHESLHGQELDAHVDFNYDERRWLHRRLNVLVYLNKEWEESWGGSIELHSDPRHPERNEVQSILPLFNRCVIFETSEYSWHAFPRINLPEDKRHLSRKSFSIYLYTKERPIEEVTAPHTTFYIQRPLPNHIKPGYTLSNDDFEAVQGLIYKRDSLIEFYQRLLVEKEQRMRQIISNHTQAGSSPPPLLCSHEEILNSRSWKLACQLQRIYRLSRKMRGKFSKK